MRKKQLSVWEKQQLTIKTQMIKLTAPILSIVGLLGVSFPSVAVTDSYANDYRSCAARVLSTGLDAQAAAQACANAFSPRDLSICVADISKQTKIAPVDALAGCRRSRLPRDLATCVISVSRSTEGAVNPDVLNYCGRSLLPLQFAQCVVGLRKEVNLAPIQALDTCIDGSDRIVGVGGVLPKSNSSAPTSTEFAPSFQAQPLPTIPNK